MAKTKRFIDNQERYAKDNYSGLEGLGQQLLDQTQMLKDFGDEAIKVKNKARAAQKDKSEDEDALYDKWENTYNELKEMGKDMNTTLIVIGLKLSNVTGHALNAHSTKMIKKVIEFLDTYSLNDKFIHSGLLKVASGRTTDGDILDMALVVAAKHDDVAFAKYIIKFAEKNKKRENIYDHMGVPYDLVDAGNMNSISSIYKRERIAFEALISNAPKVYDFITDNKGLSDDMVLNYIDDRNKYISKLTKQEAANVIQIKPNLIDDIIEFMPDNVPDDVKEMFLF